MQITTYDLWSWEDRKTPDFMVNGGSCHLKFQPGFRGIAVLVHSDTLGGIFITRPGYQDIFILTSLIL